MKNVDVVVIGGSLAGAACARELTRRGIEAVALERERFPREKVCGGFLSPGAVELLEELGLKAPILAAGATTVRSARVRMGRRDIRFDLPGIGMGISRRSLDAVVADHPAVRHGAVRHVERDRERFRIQVDDTEWSARVIIDAAGKLSRFTPRRSAAQFGVQFYVPESRADVLDFWFFDGGYGGAVSVEGGRSNACFLAQKHALRKLRGSITYLTHPTGDCPSWTGGVAARSSKDREASLLRADGVVDPEKFLDPPPRRFAPPLLSRRGDRSPWDSTSILVTGPIAYDRGPADFIAIGDAAGMVDPFCGEGMRHALDTGIRAARIVAQGLARGDNYDAMRECHEAEWDSRWRTKRTLGRLVRRMLQYPRLASTGFCLNPEYWLRRLWT